MKQGRWNPSSKMVAMRTNHHELEKIYLSTKRQTVNRKKNSALCMNSENTTWKKNAAAEAAAMTRGLRSFIAFGEDGV